jgi:hypothetical protein
VLRPSYVLDNLTLWTGQPESQLSRGKWFSLCAINMKLGTVGGCVPRLIGYSLGRHVNELNISIAPCKCKQKLRILQVSSDSNSCTTLRLQEFRPVRRVGCYPSSLPSNPSWRRRHRWKNSNGRLYRTAGNGHLLSKRYVAPKEPASSLHTSQRFVIAREVSFY